jgi:hypothetical protein
MSPPVDAFEETVREALVCLGCGGPKQAGPVVCWHCFKHRTDVVPFKAFAGTLQQWLANCGRLQ